MHPKHIEFLSHLRNVEDHDGYKTAQCPAHEDRQNSLSVSVGDNPQKPFVWHCHAGCDAGSVSRAMGFPMSHWYENWGRKEQAGKKGSAKGNRTAAYVYYDEQGAILMRACRYDGFDDQGIPTKTFTQERPNGTGGWISGVKGIRKVPYRLPELLATHESEAVYIVEGEKCVDRLRELGLTATCNAAGAGKWTKEHGKFLLNRDVVILPDCDEPGEKHAAKVCETLKGIAKSVKVVRLPNLPVKGDVVDWLKAGGSREELDRLVAGAVQTSEEEFKPAEAPREVVTIEHDKQVVDAIGLDVFGEDEKGHVHVFSLDHRKGHVFRDVNKITLNDLLQVCGPRARQVVYEGDDDSPEGMYKLKAVRQAIASLSGYRRIDDQSELGVGIWEGRGDDNQHDSILMINAGECAVLNGKPHLVKHVLPRYGDQILDLSSSHSWFDFDRVDEHVRNYSPGWAAEVLDEATTLFNRWAYRDQTSMPAVLTGLVLATWVQTIWKWRPQVSIFGKSNSGKTTLFEVLSGTNDGSPGIFGTLAVKSSHSSAAGIRQAIRNTARIIILDELEAGRYRNEIFEMLRNAGRGDVTFRGTTSHKAKDFRLRHIVWTAATESGLKKEPDKNRFISIELIRPPEHLMGKLDTLPRDDTFLRLGEKLLTVAIKTAQAARELVERLKAMKPSGYHYRILESYSVPAACYAIGMGLASDQEALDVFTAFLGTHDKEDLADGDEDMLLDTIMSYSLDVQRGEKSSVSQAIMRIGNDQNIGDALERIGLAVCREADRDSRGSWIEGESSCLFIACDRIQRTIIRGTEWEHANISQILCRVKGAVKCRKRISGRQVRGMLLPMSSVLTEDKF